MSKNADTLRPAIAVVVIRGGVVQETRANIPLDIIIEDWDDLTGEQPARYDLWPDEMPPSEEAELVRRFQLAPDGAQAIADEQIDGLIDSLLQYCRQIAIRWSVSDVQEMRPDLSDSQCWEVLNACQQRHDAERGFTWALMETVAAELFGDAPENGKA